MIRRLSSASATFERELESLLAWDVSTDDAVTRAAGDIIADVVQRGDAALIELTARFDHTDLTAGFEIRARELREAYDQLPVADRDALRSAADRIQRYHERQTGGDFLDDDGFGNRLGQRITPLERVGVYVPGGQAAYPSTVLMTVIPARVAGVDEVIVTVPTPNGDKNRFVLAALHLAGVDRVFTVGGAQAVAALAFGTQTIPKVDKIVGPGGAFVAAAKRLVFGPVGIDVIAGPSEICIVADGSVDPEWTAMDLFSQAEHDADAQAILISPDSDYLDSVERLMAEQLPGMARASIIRSSLADRGALVQSRSLEEACEIANRVAPEHLQLAVDDPDALLPLIRHAGAIFLGAYSAEALGDYSAGPSHVLPTFGTARYASPLSVYDFQKRSSIIDVRREGAETLARIASTIADQEGLEAHGEAARRRLAGFDSNL